MDFKLTAILNGVLNEVLLFFIFMRKSLLRNPFSGEFDKVISTHMVQLFKLSYYFTGRFTNLKNKNHAQNPY